jgi:hypothetical protein
MKNFKPQKMVGWFDVGQLAGTAVRSILSSIFGTRADKRETFAALTPCETYSTNAEENEVWLDYISDSGDGFDPTYSMMRLISEEKIAIHHNGENKNLKRGNIVVFGGDQVYPAPTMEEYENRFIGPLENASQHLNQSRATDLYAIPGNHDWYDGLYNFVEIFCRKKAIGGYQTLQNRSYFAIQLTTNTWLWGLDFQLQSTIDENQFLYFDGVAKEKMKKGDNVILCTPEPSWIYNGKTPEKYHSLETFELKCIVDNGLTQKLTLTGDLHHYSRYSQVVNGKEVKHKITAGGGGAFLHPTHNLPNHLTNMHDGDFDLKETFPKVKTSRKLTFLNLLFPFKNLGFGLFLSTIHLIMAYSLFITSFGDDRPGTIFNELQSTSDIFDKEIVLHMLTCFMLNPICILILFIFIFGFYKFCDSKSSKYKVVSLFGLVHGIGHVFLMLSSLSFFSYFSYGVLKIPDGPWNALSISFMVFIAGGILSGVLVGVYLLISNLLFGMHDDEAFSSLRITHYKNFVRIHIKDNKLTAYPVGIKKTPKWSKFGNIFKTKDDIKPELIDLPIVIDL